MALTNAERQAAFKARKAETLEALAQQNAALLAEVAELRAEVDRLREKAHRLEVAALKAPASTRRRDGSLAAIMRSASSSPWAMIAARMTLPYALRQCSIWTANAAFALKSGRPMTLRSGADGSREAQNGLAPAK